MIPLLHHPFVRAKQRLTCFSRSSGSSVGANRLMVFSVASSGAFVQRFSMLKLTKMSLSLPVCGSCLVPTFRANTYANRRQTIDDRSQRPSCFVDLWLHGLPKSLWSTVRRTQVFWYSSTLYGFSKLPLNLASRVSL